MRLEEFEMQSIIHLTDHFDFLFFILETSRIRYTERQQPLFVFAHLVLYTGAQRARKTKKSDFLLRARPGLALF